eukprot:CAMPEP_0201917470 /NCGR_PEP_ID=MMETSP0903-20130614/6861_1 /ASSEMBLY_ACC=CAM_ASM_000552 /TAXON_ID=420261 /ORGANISM="Thalassiosira antarctica, Strain CCMP982" /LENGTH=375 /DNA_ID=CAMNT_0048453545 /DNA_START=109 /DNA_END=1236 /DNA_ORIENTATION=+
MSEEHRMEEYHKRGHKWPLEKMVPDTPGWKRILNKRFEQVARVEDTNDRYNGWMGFITSAIVATNYTENGWGLTRAPEHLTRRLQERLHKSLEVTKIEKKECDNESSTEEEKGECVATEREILEPRGRKEHFVNVIGGEDHARPIMISDAVENADILEEMRPMFEWWSGVDLKGSVAYGLRAYRNDSNLLMHIDKSSTHVISGIFHIDRSDDAEPWPIVIEDFQGNTNQVYLEPGDILFYESSKCFHGRPQTFIGGYYASLFMHYRPIDFAANKISNEIHYAVPEHWHTLSPPNEGLDELSVVGTSFKEPNCKNLLCSLDETHPDSRNLVNWYGPAPKGKIVTAGWDPENMTPPKEWEEGRDGGKRGAGGEKIVL